MQKRLLPIISVLLLATAGFWWWAAHRAAGPQLRTNHPVAEITPRLPGKPKDGSADSEGTRRREALILDNLGAASLPEVAAVLSDLSVAEIASYAKRLAALAFGGPNEAKIDVFFKAWAELAPQEALKSALAFPDGWARNQALEAVFAGASPAANEALVRSISTLPEGAFSDSLRMGVFAKGLENWSRVDPAGAAQFLGTLPLTIVSPKMWRDAAESWAAQDPASALMWLGKQPDAAVTDPAMQGVISGWWQKDPEAAAAYAAAHTDTLVGQHVASIIASRLAVYDPRAALEWARQLPNDFARSISETAITVAWAHNDPHAAAEWAAGLPPEDQSSVTGSIAVTWAQNDPKAAAVWIAGLQGEAHDGAALSYASAIAATDPGAALGWALSVPDSVSRSSTVSRIARGWLAQDPAAAQNWIQSSALPESEKAQLLGAAQPTP